MKMRNKRMKRTPNRSLQLSAVHFGLDFIGLGPVSGAIRRRLCPVGWAAGSLIAVEMLSEDE